MKTTTTIETTNDIDELASLFSRTFKQAMAAVDALASLGDSTIDAVITRRWEESDAGSEDHALFARVLRLHATENYRGADKARLIEASHLVDATSEAFQAWEAAEAE